MCGTFRYEPSLVIGIYSNLYSSKLYCYRVPRSPGADGALLFRGEGVCPRLEHMVGRQEDGELLRWAPLLATNCRTAQELHHAHQKLRGEAEVVGGVLYLPGEGPAHQPECGDGGDGAGGGGRLHQREDHRREGDAQGGCLQASH